MHRKVLIFSFLSCNLLINYSNADTDLGQSMQQLAQMQLRQENDLWQRIRDNFALNHQETSEVKYWEKRYANPKYFNIIMQNASYYLYFVVTELERRGLPSELAFIPIVESTYNPNAVSPAAISTGMWQFVASSGKRFGLIQDATIDERKDIVKSTKAAVTYLQYLDDLFGSWDLAIAAYNWGEGNISNALNQANSRNFYDLKLRSVTRQYLPKVIALANIVQNPQKFGIKLINLPNQPYFSVITPTKTTKVSDFISQYQLSEDLNKRLNPQYNSLSYSVNTNQRLLLPMQLNKPVANLTPNLVSANSSIPESVVINILTNQEKITAVNKPTSSAVKTLPNKQVTTVDPTSNINPAIKDLLINTIPTTSLTTTNSEAETTHYQNYTVSAGDTLYSIAKKFTVSVDLIKQDNKLGDNNLQTNQILKIRQ